MTAIRFPRPLAFVFSGGLARAAGQIGMCEVALELGMTEPPDEGLGRLALAGALAEPAEDRGARRPAEPLVATEQVEEVDLVLADAA